jgi:iron(III) transport system permease protein
MILVQGLANVTFFFLLLSAVLKNMDGGLEEASKASGASTFQTLRRVTFPILVPGIVAVLMLNFIITLGQFEVPLLFGISAGANIFSLRIFLALTSQAFGLPMYGEAAAYGVNFLMLTYFLFFFYSKFTKQANKYATVTGKGYRPIRLRLGKWKYAVLVLFPIYLIITFVIPLFALFWSSLFKFFRPVTWENFTTVANYSSYAKVMNDPQFWGALWRTFVVAGLSATVAVTIAMVTAWVVVRGKRNFVNRALDLFASSSVAIPATVAAFAFFMFYIVVGKWIPIYGTIWILILAYSFRTSVAYRNTYAGVVQINKELEEASMASGASQLATFRRIMIPLLMPHAFVAWLILFLLASHEFTIAIILSDADSNTLPVVLFNRLSTSGGGSALPDQAAAMAILFTLLMAVITLIVRGVAARKGVRAAEA